MDDKLILELYFARSERALGETAAKYGSYCHSIAYNILHNKEDSEECVNDAYLQAWNSIPPEKPAHFSAFLGKITRNLSLNRYNSLKAEKRGGGQTAIALDELEECIPAPDPTGSIADDLLLKDALNRFLGSLSVDVRKIFLRRYFYMNSVEEIAKDLGMGESKIKMALLRARKQLKKRLEKEGITV